MSGMELGQVPVRADLGSFLFGFGSRADFSVIQCPCDVFVRAEQSSGIDQERLPALVTCGHGTSNTSVMVQAARHPRLGVWCRTRQLLE